jgi:hypothetical protein
METYSVNAILETAATNICLPEQCGAKHESGKVQRITDERLCKLPSSGLHLRNQSALRNASQHLVYSFVLRSVDLQHTFADPHLNLLFLVATTVLS